MEKSLKSAVQILTETAKKFRSLHHEANEFLVQRDTKNYRQKLLERAQLLVDLPKQLGDILEDVEDSLEIRIKSSVLRWAAEAKERLEEAENSSVLFAVSVLLTHKSDNIWDLNDLEKLINSIHSQ